MNRKQKTKQWFKKHVNDPFVKKAQHDGYRSRAAYKLHDLLQYVPKKHNINILELGAAPGGWTQVLVEKYPKANITAIDLLEMQPVPGALILKGDMRDSNLLLGIDNACRPFDAILSDMMPNTSGVDCADQYALLDLLENIIEVVKTELRPGGWLIVKYLEGYGIMQWHKQLKTMFRKVAMKKPEASRSSSREKYIVALDFIASK